MEEKEMSREFEEKRLADTIAFAELKLEQARRRNEDNEEAILSAKQEMRENASHSVGDLWSSDAFEALAEMNQYASAVTDKVFQFETVEKEIVQLEKLIQAPYFARIDFQFAGEDKPEKVYIGRHSLMEEETFDMYVYDWRSPIASVFYRFAVGPAFYDAPAGRLDGEVSLKRQFEVKKGQLEYFFDADVQIVDEFLRQLLSHNTSTKMKAIVETIQKEQDVVIRDLESDLLMVQGVAGSGKTSIALHRAAYLMYQGLAGKLTASNILIVSPNTLFAQYISKVLPELGEDHVETVVFEEIAAKILKRRNLQSRNQFLESLISHSRFREIRKQSIEFKTSKVFQTILDRFLEDLPQRWIQFFDVHYEGKRLVSKEALRERVLALSERRDISLGFKLAQLDEFLMEQARQQHGERLNRREVQRIREEIPQFTKPDVEALYRKLWYDRGYFLSLAQDLELPAGLDDIFTFTRENLTADYTFYDDTIALTYLKLRIFESNRYQNIRQVVVDEAQDYYPLQYEIFGRLFPQAKFTVLGDINQTLEKGEDMTLYDQIGRILNKKKASLATMDKSFRCTNEILNFGARFIDQQAIEVKSFNREGEEPQIQVATNQDEYLDLLKAEVKACQDQGYQSIGLICKTERDAQSLQARLKNKLDAKLIRHGSTEDVDGVFVIPVYMSKGLEFDAVLVCDVDAKNYQSEDDKKLLYIACTRALHRLNLFCFGQASPLLTDPAAQ